MPDAQSKALAISYAIKRRNRKAKICAPEMMAEGGVVQNPKLMESKMSKGGMMEDPMSFASRLVQKKMKYADGGQVGDVDEADGMDELNDEMDRPIGGMGHVDEGDSEFENDPMLSDNEMGMPEDEMKMRKGILAKLLRNI